jgi:hypothetical protein
LPLIVALYDRFSLRPTTPVYGWWYFFMLFECVGKQLGQIIPRFPPTTDAEVDSLLDLKIRVYDPFLILDT